MIDRFTCHGNESKLADCDADDYGTYDEQCRVGGGVRCEGDSVTHTIFLLLNC